MAECGGVRVGGQLEDAEQQKNLNKDLEPAAEMLPTECVSVQQKERQTPEIWDTMRDTDAHEHAGPESELPTADQGCAV